MRTKFKSGAASFYVVAFSTLILVIIAASFATAIIAEITRAANDDLSQSAYDAALAGVEDAKLAFINYQNCIKSGVTIDDDYKPTEGKVCQNIIYWMNHPDCDMVAHILGRIGIFESGEVLIEETSRLGSGNEMNQAYTCAMIEKNPSDYRGTLSASNPYRIVRVNLDGVEANRIKSVKVSWMLSDKSSNLRFNNVDMNKVIFRSLSESTAPIPSTLAVRLLQTAESFSLEDLNGVSSEQATDRATVYLVPTNSISMASKSEEGNYEGVYNSEKKRSELSAYQIAKTNDKKKDVPYAVYCPGDSTEEFVCSAMLNLPEVINGTRSNSTFMFMIALPYVTDGQPETDFMLEFFCDKTNDACGRIGLEKENGEYVDNVAATNNIQITVDSTGRANDLYRRVEVRLGPDDSADALSWYAIQAFDDDADSLAINKKIYTTKEFGL